MYIFEKNIMLKLKISISFFSVILIFSSCSSLNVKRQLNRSVITSSNEEMLVGRVDLSSLLEAPYADWYNANYEGHTVDKETTQLTRNEIRFYSVKVFFGTWSLESQKHLPAFIKVMHQLKFPMSRIELVAANRQNRSFYGEEIGEKIKYLPTFIFYKNNKEMGRIVNSPVETIERDILSIIKKDIIYKPQY